MKKSLFLLMLTASLSAYAANHEVKMLDNGKDGSMVFEPGYVNAKVGDTVTFKAANSGHWVQSKALPDGVADFLSEDGKDFTLKLDKEGVYVYTCPPHRMMNMSGVIQVGKPVNKAKAQAVVDEMENRAMQSKGRSEKIHGASEVNAFMLYKGRLKPFKTACFLCVKHASKLYLPFQFPINRPIPTQDP